MLSLEERGHSGAYDELLKLLDKHKKKSILEIAQAENLDVLDTSRLYYASTMKTVLGSHGIEAWNEGREITTIRWGIGAGYISYDEAVNLIKPVIERIKKNYISMDDYKAHYIAGRSFYNPNADALKWEEVQKLYNKKADVQILASLEELEAGFPDSTITPLDFTQFS